MRRSVLTVVVTLATCSVIDAGERMFFARDVVPALTTAGCSAGGCHGSPKAKEHGGFRLSLLGENPLADYVAIVDGPGGPLIDEEEPDRSRLLRRASGEESHDSYDVEAPAAVSRVIRLWIASGTPEPRATDPRITSIRFERERRTAAIGDILEWTVQATDSRGATFDVTAVAKYRVATGEHVVLKRGEDGYRVSQVGRSVVVARYAGRTATTVVDVPFGDETEFAFDSANPIDRHLATTWRRFGLEPASVAEDNVLGRRAWVHLAGNNPDADDLARFVASNDPAKWRKWIDAALEAPTAANHAREQWIEWLDLADGSRTEDEVQRFTEWLEREQQRGTTVQEIAERMLLADGRPKDDPAVGYLLGGRDDAGRAALVARDFVGVNERCFACHVHPGGDWTTADHHGLVAIVHGLDVRGTKTTGRRLEHRSAWYRHPTNRSRIAPAVLRERLDVDPAEGDPRRAFVDWLFARDNLAFARVVVNRYWDWMMSAPLLPDGEDAWPPRLAIHPDLLDDLARDLVAHDYDARHLVRTIAMSRAYRLANDPIENPEREVAAGPFHRDRRPQRLPAPVLVRLVRRAAGVGDDVPFAAAGMPFAPVFLRNGGRPRSTECEQEDNNVYLSSALHLLNSDGLAKLIQHPEGRARTWADSERTWRSYTDEVFAATLCRGPREDELKAVEKFVEESFAKPDGRKQFAEDLLWALINTREFIFLP